MYVVPGARRAAAALAAAFTLLAMLVGSPAQAATVKDPVLLIGGILAQQADMDGAAVWLRSAGFTVFSMRLAGSPPGTASIKVSAAAVRTKVAQIRRRTRAARVDIVAHSEGGLAGRYYVKYLGGLARTGRFIDMGTPNYGGWDPLLCIFYQGCVDMLPGSAFLAELNSGDPTPGAIRYFHFFSENERGERIPLPGATSASVQSFCPGRLVKHAAEWNDGAMRQLVAAALETRPLAATCPA